MSKTLDFQVGTDTGEADANAIQPVRDGEKVFADVQGRPDHNLRLRTEVLRAEANHQRWLRDADQAVTYFLSGGTITWGGAYSDGTGELVLTDTESLIVAPMYGPGESRSKTTTGGFDLEGTGTRYPALRAFVELDDGNYGLHGIAIVSKKFDHEGGNQITITITDVPNSGAVLVSVEGDGTVSDPSVQPGQDDIKVTYDSVAGHDITDVVDAINDDPVANQLVWAMVEGSDAGAPAYDVATSALADGIDGVLHVITEANLAAFFATDTANLLREGDILAIYYETPRQRRRSIEETAEEIIPAASLVNLTAEPHKAPNCVVIGRVNENEFVLTNGVRMPEGVSIASLAVASDGIIRADYERPIASPPASGTGEGSKRLGVDASTFTVLSTLSESQQDVNEDIDTEFASVEARFDVVEATFKKYTSLADFIANTSGGEYGLIEHEQAGVPWARVAAIATGNNVWCCDTDGQYLVIGEEDGTVTLRDRLTLAQASIGGFDGEYELAWDASPINTIHTNGKYVAAAYGTYGQVWERDTGNGLFTFDHTALCLSCCQDGVRAYFCGGVASSNNSMVAFTLSPTAALWGYNHGGVLVACCTDGRRVYCAGFAADGTGNSTAGVDLVALDAVTGTLIWENERTGGTSSLPHGIATDGEYVYVTSISNAREIYDATTGVYYDAIAGEAQYHIAIDREYEFLVDASGGYRFRLNRRYATGLTLYPRIDMFLSDARDVTTDCELIFVAQDEDAGDLNKSLVSYRRFNRDRRWKRVDRDAPPTFWPFQLLAIPTGD